MRLFLDRYRRSLAPKLISAMLAVVVLVAVLLSLYATAVLHRTITSEFEGKAQAIALSCAAQVSETGGGATRFTQAYINAVKSISGVSYIYIVDPAGQVLAHSFVAAPSPAFLLENRVARRHAPRGARVRIRRSAAVELAGQQVQVVDVAAPLLNGGMVHVGMDQGAIGRQVASLRAGMVAFAAAMCMLGLCLAVWIIYALILRPIRELTQVVEDFIESGDLTADIKVRTRDEVGLLGHRFRQMVERLRSVPLALRGSVVSLAEIRAQLGSAVPQGTRKIVARVYEAETTLSGITSSLDGISRHVGALQRSAGEASRLIEEVSAQNRHVAGNVQAMIDSVGRTAGAIEEMGQSVKGVADSIQEVHQSTAWISQFVREMDRAMQKVQQNSSATTRISTGLSADAATGLAAMEKTISGIQQIRESARMAAEVIRSLGGRITQIGEMVRLIDGIAHQTNFLALNATIIAAQAGDQGLGFAVIAGEIKGLAERVGVSTREISELMGNIDWEAHSAVRAVEQGLLDVEQGVQLARETESALRQIVGSAHQAGENVAAIAAATAEQTQSSASITATIHLVATKMQNIREFSVQQAKQAERVMRSTQEMKQLTTVVQETSLEQGRRWEQISSSIASMSSMLGLLTQAQREQAQGSEQVQHAIRAIHSVSEQQADLVREFEQALSVLHQQAEALRDEMCRFRV